MAQILEFKTGHVPPHIAKKQDEFYRDLLQCYADLFSRMTWGSPSIPTWRRECQKSLERSRARRAREVPHRPLDWLFIAFIGALIVAVAVGVLVLLAWVGP